MRKEIYQQRKRESLCVECGTSDIGYRKARCVDCQAKRYGREPKVTRALCLYDLHVPYHDDEALDLAIEYGKTKKIDVLVVSELVDFYKISYWKTELDRMEFAEEVGECREMVERLSGDFPNARRVFIPGNHENRMRNFIRDKAPQLHGLPQLELDELLGLNDNGFEIFDNISLLRQGKPPFKLGKLFVIHGHEIKVGYWAINIAKLFYEKAKCNVLFGHHHKTQEWVVRKLNMKTEGSWGVGALCDLAPEFKPFNDWNHGFAIVEIHEDGYFSIDNKKIIDGRIL